MNEHCGCRILNCLGLQPNHRWLCDWRARGGKHAAAAAVLASSGASATVDGSNPGGNAWERHQAFLAAVAACDYAGPASTCGCAGVRVCWRGESTKSDHTVSDLQCKICLGFAKPI